ncbi:chemotaxis protein CheW [Salinisphaera sp. Q1T1-3]|uniref:chemotaxis protein CheW n=1 Tax=Salinisphaera sp. Q1T1-3 TaxID=2321229 RepID=UPI000E75D9CA|nr:chemotaxis protein CheW [Salinisphaera sp. Q1T1-3]RJS95186.1 chemotaxis protein CheW [Salinisphaera sp. Q1T1-3]
MTDPIAATEADTREVLVFTLGGEEYAVDILKVQEIRGYSNITRIANVPAFIKGVTNLRGAIVPIVDLRVKFALAEADYTAHTVVIVLNIGERIVGMVVDSVSDVTSLSSDQIRPAPEFGAQVDTAYLQGLASLEDRMLILIDADAMMTSREMALVDSIESETA